MSARHALTILAVEDLQRAEAFYTAAFGWPQIVRAPVYSEFALPEGMRLGLYQREGFGKNTGQLPARPPAGEITGTELYFYPDDIAEVVQRLEATGARKLSDLAVRDWGDEAAYFADPDGNVVVVARPTSPSSSSRRPRRLIPSDSPFEPVIGFSRAVRVGDIVAVSGTAPIGEDGKTVGVGCVYTQTRRCLEIVQQALERAGAGLKDVIRTRVLLKRVEDWQEAAPAHGEVFGEIRPASTFVQVAGFIDAEWLVELEVDAVVDGKDSS